MQKITMVKLMVFCRKKNIKMFKILFWPPPFFLKKLNISKIKSWIMKRFQQFVLKSYIVSKKIFLIKYKVMKKILTDIYQIEWWKQLIFDKLRILCSTRKNLFLSIICNISLERSNMEVYLCKKSQWLN